MVAALNNPKLLDSSMFLVSIFDSGALNAVDLQVIHGKTMENISAINATHLLGTLAQIKQITDAKGIGVNQFDLKADVDILASDSTASASIINAVDNQNGNGTIKTSHGGGNGSWTITGVNTLTINATASQDTFEFGSGDGGVTINGFDQTVDKLDLSGELGGFIYSTTVIYGGNVHDHFFVKHTGSAALDVSGVSALFVTLPTTGLVKIDPNDTILFLHQDDSGTDFAAQIFLVANNSGTINVTQIATLTGISTLDYTNIVGLTS